jgi:alkanesulfonate monooxygenase SsuD/methylene tetrahydromethanopterin reductase-like flavin-dependent oxidoreductase (luciferase family)
VKFGIFYEISVPRPWEANTEYQVYQNCLEQVRLADELGFDQVWAVEHHFLEEYSHCSAPRSSRPVPCRRRTPHGRGISLRPPVQ